MIPTFGEKLKQMRRTAGLSAAQLAARCDITHIAVRVWERNAGMPSLLSAIRIAEALGGDLRMFQGCRFPADLRKRRGSRQANQPVTVAGDKD